MSKKYVLSAQEWKNNGDFIAAVVKMHWKPNVPSVDFTYGKGNWWTKARPKSLTEHDLAIDGMDFRATPYAAETWSQIAFDPPYVSVGGRVTSGIKPMLHAYGTYEAPKDPAVLQQLINDGLSEMWRVCAPRGRVLVRCQNYITSGKVWLGAYYTLEHALSLGFTVRDIFEPIMGRPRNTKQSQIHARRNHSTLYVLEAPR